MSEPEKEQTWDFSILTVSDHTGGCFCTAYIFIVSFHTIKNQTRSYKKECALAHSRAEARLLRQPSTLAPSAHPRGAFLFHRMHFPMR